MNKSYKIFYKLFILPSETHFGIPVSECNCGVCPNFVVKKNSLILEKGEKYFCRIMQKVMIVSDANTAVDCFRAWFSEGDYMEKESYEKEQVIPIKQRNFYTTQFMDIDTNEFQNGFKELDLEIVDCELINS